MGLGAGRSLRNVCRAERSAPEECQGPREGPLLPKAHGEGMRQQMGGNPNGEENAEGTATAGFIFISHRDFATEMPQRFIFPQGDFYWKDKGFVSRGKNEV